MLLVCLALVTAACGDDSAPTIDAAPTPDVGVGDPDAASPDASPTEIVCDDGGDNDADGDTDCADADCADETFCEDPETTCDDAFDNDGDGAADCLDSGCNGVDGCEIGAELSCVDGFDNDADGATDCDDTDCDGVGTCETTERTCDDGIDNDEDGLVDCLDDHCNALLGCEFGAELTCGDGLDNDGDGQIDCLDGNCDGVDGCELGAKETCDDGFDNDADGTTDCADGDCNGVLGCELGTELTCTDALDNDADGTTDCGDADCDAVGFCEFLTEISCVDGNDNDGDGASDCADDDCDGIGSCEFGAEASCGDTSDNDADGLTDCADGDCTASLSCTFAFTCPAGHTSLVLTATDTPVTIPDSGAYSSSATVSATGLLSFVAVGLDITHTYTGDLDMNLDSPGSSYNPDLSSDNGAGGDDFDNTIFIDSAPTNITAGTAPYAGQYRPEQAFDPLVGTEVNGAWTLVGNDDAGGDEGVLHRFEVAMCYCTVGGAGCEFGAMLCRDGVSTDDDALVDCADPDCATDATCIPEADCDNGLDEDLDTLIDCDDPSCNGLDGCQFGAEATCDDLFDNDSDGLVDCDDTDCDLAFACQIEADCADGLDDDGDGFADCLDAGCDGAAGCEFNVEESCTDSFDNDGDALVDCSDTDCGMTFQCRFSCPADSTKLVFSSTDTPLAIPENDTTGAPSIIAVTSVGGFITNVALNINVTHANDTDVDINLISPANPTSTTFNVSTDNGSTGDNYVNTLVHDDAPGMIGSTGYNTAPFSDQPGYRPEVAFSPLDTRSPNGDWTLRVADDSSTVNGGTFDSWRLGLCVCQGTDCEDYACRDGLDADGDTLIDCADPDCAADAFCIPEPDCDDAIDNDLDTLVDCDDADCDGVSGCEFGAELSCGDQFDNDSDATTDCADPNCVGGVVCTAEAACADGLDDDADSYTDCDDPGCNNVDGCEYLQENTCSDGFDNDSDGTTDCADADCAMACATLVCDPADVLVSYYATDLPLTVTTTGSVHYNSYINVDHTGSVVLVAVEFTTTHTYDGDVDLTLYSPLGTARDLSSDNGGTNENFTDTVFVDTAATAITAGTAPYTGQFRPEAPLSLLTGESVTGQWRLNLYDDAGGDGGIWSEHRIAMCVDVTP